MEEASNPLVEFFSGMYLTGQAKLQPRTYFVSCSQDHKVYEKERKILENVANALNSSFKTQKDLFVKIGKLKLALVNEAELDILIAQK